MSFCDGRVKFEYVFEFFGCFGFLVHVEQQVCELKESVEVAGVDAELTDEKSASAVEMAEAEVNAGEVASNSRIAGVEAKGLLPAPDGAFVFVAIEQGGCEVVVTDGTFVGKLTGEIEHFLCFVVVAEVGVCENAMAESAFVVGFEFFDIFEDRDGALWFANADEIDCEAHHGLGVVWGDFE